MVVGWDKFAGFLIIVRVARLKYAQAILDCDTRGDDQEGAGEILRVLAGGVNRLPGDQHGHDGCFAAACRHFQGEAEQSGICLLIGLGDLI
jgi:hypothetical protein